MSSKLQIALSLGFLGVGLFVGSRFSRQSQIENTPASEVLSELASASNQDPGSDRMLAIVATKLASIEARLARLDSDPSGDAEEEVMAAAPAAPAPSASPSPVAVAAKTSLFEMVDANLKRGLWTDKDRDRFQLLLAQGQLSPEEYDQISDRVILAVNRQELKVETPGFPLMPILRR